jgi:uncharacterized protein (DUF302 family)
METGREAMNTKLGWTVTVKGVFEGTVARVTEALKTEGFGVLTEIDVKETMKKKIGAEYPPFKILGACNPSFAHRALAAAPELGLLLPCNVVVRQIEPGTVEVSLIDPMQMIDFVGKPELSELGNEARTKFERIVATLKN